MAAWYSGGPCVDPVHDRLLGLGQRRRRVLLLEAPAVDVVNDRNAAVVGREVPHVRAEVADARVGDARAHRRVRQLGERVVEAQEQAADVGQRGWRLAPGAGRGCGNETRASA